jgi:hypothetical protein
MASPSDWRGSGRAVREQHAAKWQHPEMAKVDCCRRLEHLIDHWATVGAIWEDFEFFQASGLTNVAVATRWHRWLDYAGDSRSGIPTKWRRR